MVELIDGADHLFELIGEPLLPLRFLFVPFCNPRSKPCPSERDSATDHDRHERLEDSDRNIRHGPHLSVDLLAAQLSRMPCPVKAEAAGGVPGMGTGLEV